MNIFTVHVERDEYGWPKIDGLSSSEAGVTPDEGDYILVPLGVSWYRRLWAWLRFRP
ncbi:hypothetical protein LCGC14_0397500 [marine sediment metagenome]|uniref:Uncharacterized protein n=1 Tax=marine sediment metagenome TaxID=412755 RepID=A0A0F9VJW9_9ZZZZ